MYSLQQAAKAAGKSKPTLSRAIKAGRLSATRTESGAYEIDPAELARVFPLAGDMTGTVKQLEPPRSRPRCLTQSPLVGRLGGPL